MWTETHFYRLAELPEYPASAAIDIVGEWGGFKHVNARWMGEEPTGWAEFRVYPETPRQDFA